MNWKILIGNFVACFFGLVLFELLYPHGSWGQLGARVSLLLAGGLLGNPWDKPEVRDA